ncbi:hypothetical protein HC723_03535 [Vibrio sp. S11_S32]|uniref:hypothetical protein n=1 Tax=Vibrio sp. S11_S32 TaxID=2720225 RepID=UPI0016802D74|nr:hypothetical protein [Vibrio sp. S11_S32]MBD1575529.1 hypothetical protein [Vibrio sp. S11_S32]
MARLGMVIQTILAASIFYLGYTIYSFTSTITSVVETSPQVLSDINATADKLQIDQWLQVARTFENLTPRALTVAEKMQGTASDINKTVGDVNKTVASVNRKIPGIVKEVHGVNKQIPNIFSEVKAIRTQTVPALVKETSSIRKELPPMLVQVNQILDKSGELSEQAAQGAVKGVILSPINLIKDAGEGIKSKVSK